MRSAMRVAAVAVAVALGVSAMPADDNNRADDKDQPFTDAGFVTKAASSGMHEVELGRIAQENAANGEIKKFGERMVTDHGKANKDLMDAAKKANIPVPDKMLDEHVKHIDRFKKLKGSEFDQAYIKHMVESHTKGSALFERASKEARDPGLKAFAAKTLPTIKEHLELAQKLEKTTGGGR